MVLGPYDLQLLARQSPRARCNASFTALRVLKLILGVSL